MELALVLVTIAGVVTTVLLLLQRASILGRASAAEASLAQSEAMLGEARKSLEERTAELDRIRAQLARAEQEVARLQEKLIAEQAAQSQAKAVFADVAAKVMNEQREAFLALAAEQFNKQFTQAGVDLERRQKAVEEMLRPIREALAATEKTLGEMRTGHERVSTRLEEHARIGDSLRAEVSLLGKALRQPQVRGHWGEIHLRRVIELAGMRNYCDFVEQETQRTDEGRRRPDVKVRLPNGRHIVIDAKANLQPYLDALQARTPEEAEARYADFALSVAKTVDELGSRRYWEQADGSPDFVVMYMPGEQLIDEALRRKPDLLEKAAESGVLIAGPASLIGLLRAVYLGFQEQMLSENARKMGDLVADLHKRLAIVLDHADDLGAGLKKAVESWNKFVGSVTDRLLPKVREIEATGVKPDREPAQLMVMNQPLRSLPAPEERTPPVSD
jgi:DNA recombination protein RmuC